MKPSTKAGALHLDIFDQPAQQVLFSYWAFCTLSFFKDAFFF
jgi:hypothetical protein